jgi:iron complex outermembrane receptor protein
MWFARVPVSGIAAVVFIGTLTVYAGEYDPDVDYDEIRLLDMTVVSTRIPRDDSGSGRSVGALDQTDIDLAPVRSPAELLDHMDGVDLQTRGPHGIQADLSIRGSTFNQTAILIDGMPANDSQTGHHNLDLPMTLEDVERVEVLRGHGSSLYGSGAFGGVVNFITRKPKKREMRARAYLGEDSTWGASVHYAIPHHVVSGMVSAERRHSDGFRDGLEYDVRTTLGKGVIHLPWGDHSVMLCHTEKDFGAYDFYTPGDDYPSEERTETTLATYGAVFAIDKVTIRPRLSYRRHRDSFVLDSTDPSFFSSRHRTETYTGAVYASSPLGKRVTLSGGVEATGDEIDSTVLGDHDVTRSAGMVELAAKVRENGPSLNLGLRFDHYSSFGSQWSPSLSGQGKVHPAVTLRGSVGRSFRAPTFTERYYVSPANVGDRDLDPEQGWSYEAGADCSFAGGVVTGRLTGFFRDQDDLIDWIKSPPAAAQWTATNITSAEVYGAEAGVRVRPSDWSSISIAYTRTVSDMERDGIYVSKYALIHPRHHVQARAILVMPYGYGASLRVSHKDRKHGDSFTLVDVHVEKVIPGGGIFLEATNVFDVDYEDVTGVEQPGRWITGGLRIAF